MHYYSVALWLLFAVQYTFAVIVGPNERIEQCFRGRDCQSLSVLDIFSDNSVSASDCCTVLGGKFLNPPPEGDAIFTCVQCINAGFSVANMSISGSNGLSFITVESRAPLPATLSSLQLQISIINSDPNRSLSEILDLSNYPLPLSPFNFPNNSITETVVRRFGIKVRSVENSIALQERARYILRLNLISQPEDSSFLYTNRDIHLSITDPDIVHVGFDKRIYTFSESERQPFITLSLSSTIGQPIKVQIKGDTTRQISNVFPSRTELNRVIEFIPNGPTSINVPLSIRDDNIGTEDLESFAITASLVDTNDERIRLGSPTLYESAIISIKDDEEITVQMERSVIRVNETVPAVNVCAVLSSPSVREISVTFSTSSVTANDPNDYIGGVQRRTFQPNQTRVCASYALIPDNEEEAEESFIVSLSRLTPTLSPDRLKLGTLDSTSVTIVDARIEAEKPRCTREIDVMFILDSSGSIGQSNYTTMIEFVSEVARRFQFGSEGARFGVVTFSTLVSLDIPLGRHTNAISFNKEIMSIPYKARTTNTADAIARAREELKQNGRQGVPQAIILFTDGQSDKPVSTLREASEAKNEGIRLLSIGIGPKIDMVELKGIASPPSDDNVFHINSFSRDQFVKILGPIIRETCEVQIGFAKPRYIVSENGSFVDVSFGVLNGTLNRDVNIQFSFIDGTATMNDDYTGKMKEYTIRPSQLMTSARFNIMNDFVPEPLEFFTASIQASDEFVKVTQPSTRIGITDDDVQVCGGKIDMIVVMDSSSSILPQEFNMIKSFVSHFSSEFPIATGQAQFGVIAFSDNAHLDIGLGEFDSPNALTQAINSIQQRPGLTNTAGALSLAREELIRNGRDGVPHTVLVITDGQSNNREATLQEAASTRANGVEIFAIGIGRNIDEDELDAIASDPDDTHVSLLEDYTQEFFDSLLKPLAERVCEPSCQRKIDFMFVVDSSGSISRTEFNAQKDFLVEIVKQYNTSTASSEPTANFGLVVFSTMASVAIELASLSGEGLVSAINALPYQPGTTNTAAGIRLALQQFLLNGRTQTPQVMIVLTDGASNDFSATVDAAESTKQSGVDVFAVGIGDNVNRNELEEIATDKGKVFDVKDFKKESFDAILSSIVRDTCNVPPCRTPPLDIVFALDGSSSVGLENFMNLLNFVSDVSCQYEIERTSGTQVGVVTFSSSAVTNITLPQYQTKASLSSAIVSIPYPRGGTSTHLGLQEARNQFSTNGRRGAKSILIVATDGQSNNPLDTAREAGLVMDANIEVFSIGIGSRANQEELRIIASDPDSTHVLTIRNFTAQSFTSIIESLNKGICKKPLACNREADVVFAIDSSIQTGESDFNSMKQFIIDVVSEVAISQSLTRVGLVRYSTRPQLIFSLARHSDIHSLTADIISMEYKPGERNTGAAIDLAGAELRENGRVGVAKIMFVLTGGSTQDMDSLLEAVSDIDDLTIVAIGTNGNRRELRSIASAPKLAFPLDSIDLASLRTIKDTTVDLICTTEPNCEHNVMFLVDQSTALSSADFQSLNSFMINIVNQFEISESTSRFGLLTFGGDEGVSTHIRLGSVSDKTELIQLVRTRQRPVTNSGKRQLHEAIEEAGNQLSNFASPRTNVVVIFLTGPSDDPAAAINKAMSLHSNKNTEIFVIYISSRGITDQVNNELTGIASMPPVDHVFTLHNYRKRGFDDIFDVLVKEFCDDDSNVIRDPMFSVPLSGPPNTPSLCYEVYGAPDKNFNIFSERCISINAHYISQKPVRPDSRPLHIIDSFGIKVLSSKTPLECTNIIIKLKGRDCLVLVDGKTLREGEYKRDSVHIMVSKSEVFLSASNCEKGSIGFHFKSKTLTKQIAPFLEVQVEGGSGITTSAHGLVGQFWNATVNLKRSNKIKLRDGSASDERRFTILEFLSKDGTVKKTVGGIMGSHSWGSTKEPCLYAGDSEGGRMYEILEPKSSLLDGSYKDYIVKELLTTGYKFSQFADNNCY